jgi:hypothetical protein
MSLSSTLRIQVDAIFKAQWTKRAGRVVPEPEDLKLAFSRTPKLEGGGPMPPEPGAMTPAGSCARRRRRRPAAPQDAETAACRFRRGFAGSARGSFAIRAS